MDLSSLFPGICAVKRGFFFFFLKMKKKSALGKPHVRDCILFPTYAGLKVWAIFAGMGEGRTVHVEAV